MRWTLTSTTGEAGDRARGEDRVEALFDAGDVFFGNRTTDDLRGELEALAGLIRLDVELHPGELAGTTGLLLVGVVDVGRAADGVSR